MNKTTIRHHVTTPPDHKSFANDDKYDKQTLLTSDVIIQQCKAQHPSSKSPNLYGQFLWYKEIVVKSTCSLFCTSLTLDPTSCVFSCPCWLYPWFCILYRSYAIDYCSLLSPLLTRARSCFPPDSLLPGFFHPTHNMSHTENLNPTIVYNWEM